MPSESVENDARAFKRALGLLDASAVVVGSMIGSGIFLVSAETARHVGSPALLLLCWMLAGFLTVIAALCYSELSSLFPQAGGQYLYLREAYGPLAGFLYGWTVFLVIQSGSIAAVGVAFAKFLGVFAPAVSSSTVLIALGSWQLTLLQVIAVALIAFLTWMNCRGIDTGKQIQTSCTLAKVAALALFIVIGLMSFDQFHGAQVNFSHDAFWAATNAQGRTLRSTSLVLAMGLAMVGPLFACDAWNNITFAGEEVQDAARLLPTSLTVGTLLVVVLYVVANVMYLVLLPLHGQAHGATILDRGIMFASEDRVGTAATEVLFGAAGTKMMAAAMMLSTFGCLNGLILAGARVSYTMARDGLFFRHCGTLHRLTRVPVFGLVMQGVWSSILATSGSYSALLEYVMVTTLLFYVATVAGLLVLRTKRPEAPRHYRVPLYPVLPVVSMVATAVLMIGMGTLHPAYAGAGLAIVVSRLPVYVLWQRQHAA